MIQPGPLGHAVQATGSEGSALFAFLELQFLVAAYKAARSTFASARGLATVNTLLRDGDFYTTIFAVVDIALFHFTAFRHNSYLLSEDTTKRYTIPSIYNQDTATCQGDTNLGDANLDGRCRQNPAHRSRDAILSASRLRVPAGMRIAWAVEISAQERGGMLQKQYNGTIISL